MNHSLEDLEALAVQFDTDKQAGQNEYLALYLEYFQRQGMKRDEPLHILEIGTNKGSSLRMWAEYYPNARVCGLDITREYELPGMLDHPNIHTAIVDQGDRDALFDYALAEEVCVNPDGFDVIIDDGSHDQTHQQVSLGALFGFLRRGGLYVIEDIITGENWWDGNLYNKGRIIPTRSIVQILEQNGKLESPVMESFEIKQIEETYDYCEYRESPAVIYSIHHPQLAFIGKK